MKVMFIYTDIGISVGYSCGIGVLSAYLKKHGHQTRLIHVSDELGYPLDPERIARDVIDYDPGLVCFSAVTNQWKYVRTIAKFLRRASKVPIVIGGHHANAAAREMIAEDAVDFVCRGEGEQPLLDLVSRLESGQPTAALANMLVKHVNGSASIRENPVGCFNRDLDALPYEDREIFDFKRIVDSRSGWAEVIATRGCPYACTYCFNLPYFEMYQHDLQAAGDKLRLRDFVRRRSVDSTIGMLRDVKERYDNVKYFTFVDDVFAIYSRWLADLAPRYRDEIGLPFAATSQPLAFDEKIARLLREMGCKVVKMGIEAGNPEIRNSVLNRNIPDSVLADSFGLARKYGLKPQAFNMIGLPTETTDDMIQTARLNARLRPYIVWVSTFMPYPGTELDSYCRHNDLIDSQRWNQVGGYRGSTVLKETTFRHADLERVRVMFRWHLNASLGNECSAEYQRHIDDLWGHDDDRWLSGEMEPIWQEREKELDGRFRASQIDHYVGKKYINMLWAKEYGHDLS
jgi:anaerobic magnesium-protoporphyrin IX monomethyl ester cyclase